MILSTWNSQWLPWSTKAALNQGNPSSICLRVHWTKCIISWCLFLQTMLFKKEIFCRWRFQSEILLLQLVLLSFIKINQDVPIQWIPNLPVTPFKYRLSLDPPITMHSCNAFTSPFHALLKHEVVWLLCKAQPKNTICLILHRDIALKHTPLSQHLLNQIFLIEP